MREPANYLLLILASYSLMGKFTIEKWFKKSTKANIKDFFKSINVKPSQTMIERFYEKHKNEN